MKPVTLGIVIGLALFLLISGGILLWWYLAQQTNDGNELYRPVVEDVVLEEREIPRYTLDVLSNDEYIDTPEEEQEVLNALDALNNQENSTESSNDLDFLNQSNTSSEEENLRLLEALSEQ